VSSARTSELPSGAVMVVGGGIAGIQASLDLADQGFRVYLVESKSAIGGHMAKLDKTFPTNDCAMCTISPKLVEVGRHLNIELLVDTEVLGVDSTNASVVATAQMCVQSFSPIHSTRDCLSDVRLISSILKLSPTLIPSRNLGSLPAAALVRLGSEHKVTSHLSPKVGTAKPCE